MILDSQLNMPPQLPLELIEECYRCLFPVDYFEPGMDIQKPAWKDIESLTLASKQSRELILNMWFHVLHISHLEDIDVLRRGWFETNNWMRCSNRTRVMWFTTPDVNLIPSLKLKQFQRLHSFRFDLWPSNSEEGSDISAPEVATVLDGISDARDNIEHLVLHGIDWLDPFVMWAISERFPNLRSLQFRQPQVWCGVCNTTGMPSFEENPMRIIYDDGNGLPAGYSKFLAPLKQLRTTKFTLACIPFGSVSYETLFLSQPIDGRKPPSVSLLEAGSRRPRSQSQKLTGWTGECDTCMMQLSLDADLRRTWLSRREQDETRDNATMGKATPRPPSLRRVEWEILDVTSQNWLELSISRSENGEV